MFQKPYRVKNSVTVRNSDRRKVKSRLASFFANFSEDQIGGIIPAKGDVKENKLYTHKGDAIILYTQDDEPVLLEMSSGILLPYLYPIWKYSLKLPSVHVPPFLLEKFQRGADLMAPGIIIPPHGVDQTIEKHKAIVIKVVGQKHPIAVGVAEQSASDLSGSLHGKAVKIVSVIGDQLWGSGSKNIPPQELDPEMQNICVNYNEEEEEEFREHIEDDEKNDHEDIQEVEEEAVLSELPQEDITQIQDELLDYCFKAAIKTKLQPEKEKYLPILCSTFYSQMMLTCVPADKTLEIKKTSVKKLSKYLNERMNEGILKLETAAKGVERISSVDFKSKFFSGFVKTEEPLNEVEETKLVEVMGAMCTKNSYYAPIIKTLFANSGLTREIFNRVNVANSAVLSMQDIRQHITKYVEINQLRQGSKVKLDPHLHRCIFGKGREDVEEVTWDKLFGGIQSKMGPAYSIQFPGQATPYIKKGKLPKINVTTKRVSGNKSVTLVTGFEGLLMDETYFAELIKKRAQASTSIGMDVSGKCVQVQIQGNQTKHANHIVTEVFKLDKKFLTILDNAKSGKKK